MSLSYTRKIPFLHSPPKNAAITRLFCELVPDIVCKPSPINPVNLPLLPIPKLEHTLTKLLRSAQPFVTHCELITARDVCRKFLKHDGPEIQELLIQRARDTHNWLEDWFIKCSYLYNRVPLPMNTSPVLVFPPEKFYSRCDQINYAAKLIQGVLKFRRLSLKDKLPLETWDRFPLDMEVYKKLFGYHRLPGADCDRLVPQSKDSKHVVVVYNNNFFKVTVMDDASQPISFTQLLTRLEDVVECGYSRGEPFGILTSMKRERWHGAYAHMKHLPENDEYLDDIEKSLFVVCLDESSPMRLCSYDDKKLSGCLNGFHGHGSKVNAANRWHDKTLQLYVDPDGSAGIIFENSGVGSSPLRKLADFLVSYMDGTEWLNIPFLNMCERNKMLNFTTTDDLTTAMQEGCDDAQRRSNTFSVQVRQYDKYGQEFCKDQKVSPDAVVQVAIQLAHVKCHGQFTPQQEVISTRKFYRGRSDIVRSCTCEVAKFVKSIDDPLIFLRDRFDSLINAVRVHRGLLEDGIEGRAIDCHLFGLMMACREAGRHLPKVFQTRAYLRSSKFKILSMQVPMKSDSFMCYGPSCHGGYGICYNPRKEDFNICFACKKDDCDTNSGKLAENWCCAMKRISDILCGYTRRKKKLHD